MRGERGHASVLNTHSEISRTLNTRQSTLNTQHSTLNTQHKQGTEVSVCVANVGMPPYETSAGFFVFETRTGTPETNYFT